MALFVLLVSGGLWCVGGVGGYVGETYETEEAQGSPVGCPG
jgi:hypothetical protein